MLQYEPNARSGCPYYHYGSYHLRVLINITYHEVNISIMGTLPLKLFVILTCVDVILSQMMMSILGNRLIPSSHAK
jgi:hypothetical protein